jgi:hypothetical protein
VTTHSNFAGSGSAKSNCKRLPALQGTPCHCTFARWASKNPGHRLQSEKTFQATSHCARVNTVWLMRAESESGCGTGICRERPCSGRDGSHIACRNTFPEVGWAALRRSPLRRPQGALLHPLHWNSSFALENPRERAYTGYVNSVTLTMSTYNLRSVNFRQEPRNAAPN